MPVITPITAGTHPLLKQRAMAILTPPLIDLEQTLADCMQAGETSLCVYGEYRSRKTTAALYVKKTLSAQEVLVLLIQMGKHEGGRVTKRAFWNQLRAANGNRRPQS